MLVSGVLDDWCLRTYRLHYFDAEVSSTLDLSSQLRIRRVKKSEKESYGELWDEDHGLGWGLDGPLSFVIDCVARNARDVRETINKLAVALLLFKHYDRPLHDRLAWFRLRWGGGSLWQPDQLPLIRSEEMADADESTSFYGYHLKVSDISSFQIFWNTCSKTSWHKSLLLAGSRLLLVQAREDETALEDRLIDLMIACEALVIEDKKEEQKRTKIACRVGKLQKEQIPHLEKRASEELDLAYRLRNDLVHQGEFSSENLAEAAFPDQFVMYIEQYLRVAMVNYIDLMNQGKSKNQIIQYLDDLSECG
jgi:hypothetical protein